MLSRIGFGQRWERASLLNEYEADVGDPGYIQTDLDRYRHATPADVGAYETPIDVFAPVVPSKRYFLAR